MGYYSGIERNKFELVELKWMNLEPIKSERGEYCILTHIYGIQKSSADEPVRGAGMEVRTCRADLRMQQGRERAGRTERIALKHRHYSVEIRQLAGSFCTTQELRAQ